MKIGFLTKDLDIKNGWGSYSFYLIRALQAEGVKSTILNGQGGYFYMKRAFKDCDIIHSLIEPLALRGALISGCRPLFITAHGTYAVAPLAEGGINGFRLKYAYKKAQAVICVSRFTEGEIRRLNPKTNTVVINNGVDFERFSRPINNWSPQIITGRWPIILSVGALKKRKGYHISILAVANFKKKYPDLLYIISGNQGDTQYFDELKSLVKSNNLEDNIKFIEANDEELPSLYQASDIFLLTPVNHENNFEGYGLVYLEAGAAGIPSVGAFGCGAQDAIIDGQTGILVNQNDVASTSEALSKILQDKSTREKIGQAAKIFSNRMSWSNVVKEYIRIYQESL